MERIKRGGGEKKEKQRERREWFYRTVSFRMVTVCSCPDGWSISGLVFTWNRVSNDSLARYSSTDRSFSFVSFQLLPFSPPVLTKMGTSGRFSNSFDATAGICWLLRFANLRVCFFYPARSLLFPSDVWKRREFLRVLLTSKLL